VADRDDPLFLARYPFLAAARERVQKGGLVLADLLNDSAYERTRRRAVQRVQCALERDIPEVESRNADLELYSYPLARALVAAVDDAYLTNRYAVAESKLFGRRLDEEDDATVWDVSVEVGLALEPTDDPGGFARLHFLDYLRHAPARDPAWKLVNQGLRGGFVTLVRDRTVRLAEAALKDRLLEELDDLERPGRTFANAFDKDLTALRSVVAAHRARFQADAGGPIRPEAFPPCITSIFNGIRDHVNVPHMGRFAIVSFLHTLGMTSEDILRFFSSVPDFDVNKSRYQIEHISGQVGATEYTPPGCAKMQTFGICPLEARDDLCFQIRHPLSYYRRRVRRLPRQVDAAPAKEEARAGGAA
jgi:DNA primase large subunit